MGIGDELMMAGEAKRRAAGSTKRFLMLDKRGEPKWHFSWEGNQHVARPGEHHDGTIGYTEGRRPYLIDGTRDRYVFREYRPEPAEIRLSPRSQKLAEHAAGAIVFNPAVKYRASPNKDWGFSNWKVLVARGIGYRWLQISDGAGQRLHGAEQLATPSFDEACGLISGARAVVVHEGALHHAAAAFGTPAVVIRGGFISPRVTGYAGQKDLYVEDETWPLGCGLRVECHHCRRAMASITPEAVLAALGELLARRKAA